MTVKEFHQAALAALTAAQPNDDVLIELAKQAEELADMVGWADSIIDKEGRVSEAIFQLQAEAQKQHKTTGNENVAILHDAVGVLLGAIIRHDEDLTPSTDTDDDSGVI